MNGIFGMCSFACVSIVRECSENQINAILGVRGETFIYIHHAAYEGVIVEH